MLAIHFFQKLHRCLLIHLTHVHHILQSHFKWCADEQTDMWNIIIAQNNIRTSSNYNTIFCSCQIADQIAHIKEDGIFSVKSMITIHIPQL